MAKYKVYHVDSRGQPHTAEREELAKADAELVVLSPEQQQDIAAHVADADGILCGYRQVGKDVFDAAPNLKVVVRYGIGFDNIDWQTAVGYGIVVCNITDYCINEVATHAMSLLLALNRKLIAHNDAARAGERVPLPPSGPLYGETLGLVAFGHIAQQAAIRAQAFGLDVIAYDPYQDAAVAEAAGVRLTSLEEVMQADYVSVHPPLSPETRGLVGAAELALMKPTAYLITTCPRRRGRRTGALRRAQGGPAGGRGRGRLGSGAGPQRPPAAGVRQRDRNPALRLLLRRLSPALAAARRRSGGRRSARLPPPLRRQQGRPAAGRSVPAPGSVEPVRFGRDLGSEQVLLC